MKKEPSQRQPNHGKYCEVVRRKGNNVTNVTKCTRLHCVHKMVFLPKLDCMQLIRAVFD